MRLVNMYSTPLDTGFKEKAHERVAPGQVGDFNRDNPSVQQWIKLRMLVSEGELLASRASALTNAPSVGEMLKLREELDQKQAAIDELMARDQARVDEMKRVEARLSELAANTDFADAAKARIAELEKLLEGAHADSQEFRSKLSEQRSRIAELETDLASATAPATPAAPAVTEIVDTDATRVKRKG